MIDNLAVLVGAREKELSAIYENIPGILFYIAVEPDGEFRFLSVSRDFLTATGLNRGQVVGSFVRDIIPPPSREMVLNHYREAIRTGQTVRWEEKSVYPAGQRYAEVAVTPLYDANGLATHLIGIVHDITERKRLEQRRAEDLLEAAPDGMVVVDQASRIVLINAQTEKLFGYQRQEILGQPLEVLIPHRFRERHQAHRTTFFSEPRVRPMGASLQLFGLRKDGTEFPVEIMLSPIETPDGVLVISAIRDITSRKRTEDALRVSEERLRLAQQAARIGTFERDVRTGHITWTEGLELLYGLAPGSFEGKTIAFFKNLIHPDDFERAVHVIEEALETGEPTACEWRAIWPDGSVHWIESRWRVSKDESGESLRVFGVNMDVTERKQAEQALDAHQELLRIFVKNVPAAVAMLDHDMRYLQVSDRWCSDNSLEASEVLGRSRYESGLEIPERWKEVNRRALEGETLRADEDRWESGGSTRWARWEVRPWRKPDGTVGGILVFAEDISQRKQMEEALSGMSRKLIESQEQERSRIGRELHDDVNQRLALLAIELEQLKENPSHVKVRVEKLQKRVDDISKDVQALAHDLHSSKLEYLGFIRGMKSWCKEFSARQGLQIDFKSNVRSVVPLNLGLPLFRVLQEALYNACKYSGVKRIEVQLREESGEIHLIVADNGKGFDLETALQEKGLGLTSMRERVRLVDGTITIDSKPMGGTTVHVRVPIESERESELAG